MATVQLPHLIDIESLSSDTITALLTQANTYLQQATTAPINTPLTHKTVATLFYENSTRTRMSFQLAAHRLHAYCIDFNKQGSSVSKGESLIDTAASLIAMGANVLIVRHPHDKIATILAEKFTDQAAIINAGDGMYAHPTQALLDVLTIQQHKPNFKALKVAIIGDVSHSRVARSQICALSKLGVSDIRVVAPTALLPTDIQQWPVTVMADIEQGLSGVDVVICLRIQTERIATNQCPDVTTYHQQFGVSAQRLALAKPDAIVMHPGPINRGVEIDDAVADGSQSVILHQVRNSVPMRMAVLTVIANTRWSL